MTLNLLSFEIQFHILTSHSRSPPLIFKSTCSSLEVQLWSEFITWEKYNTVWRWTESSRRSHKVDHLHRNHHRIISEMHWYKTNTNKWRYVHNCSIPTEIEPILKHIASVHESISWIIPLETFHSIKWYNHSEHLKTFHCIREVIESFGTSDSKLPTLVWCLQWVKKCLSHNSRDPQIP